MPFVPAPNIIQVEVLATKDGQQIENRFMVDVFHAPSLGDMTGIQAQVTAWCNVTYAPLLPEDVVITGLKMTDMSQQNGPQLQVALAIPGTIAGISAPNEVTYCVSLRSGLAGRSARGRWYVLGLSNSNIGGQNRVGPVYRANIASAVQQLVTRMTDIGFAFVIVSYINNNAPRVGGPVYFPVITVTTTDDILDSQRRRRPGIGT